MSTNLVQSNISRFIFSVVCAICIFTIPAHTETLSGQVVDPQEKSITGAQIRLFDRNSGEMRSAKSNEDGKYSFQGLPPGSYWIEAESLTGTLGNSQQVSIAGDQTLDLKLAISGTKTDVLVIASSTPANVDEIAKAVDVVDSQEIMLRDEISISDSVRSLPGLRVQTLEGPGSSTTIQMRGLRTQDTAILIDGMRFRDAASIPGDGSAFLEDMNVIDTERIEVLRGSGSSLYGSHALGGVINITSRPGGGPTHGQFLAEGGGLGMIRSVANVGGGFARDRFTYSAGVSHINVTKGVRNGQPYRNSGTQASAKYSFTNKLSLTGRLWYSNSYLTSTESPTVTASVLANSPSTGEVKAIALPIDQLQLYEKKQAFSAGNATFIPNQIDPDGHRLGKFFTGGLTLQHQISRNTSYHVTYQGVDTKRIYTDGPGGPGSFEPSSPSRSNFDGYTNTLQVRLDQRVGSYNLISAGYEYEGERYANFNGTVYGSPASSGSVTLRQRSNALYFQDQISLLSGKLQFTVGGRTQFFNLQAPSFVGYSTPYSDVAVVKPPTAYTADGALSYFLPASGTKFRGHVGNSFRAPSGYERFAGDGVFYYGNPTLSPERAVAVDGGIDQKLLHSKLTVSGTAFYTNLQQTVVFANSLPAGDPFGRFFGYQNGGGGIARGLEFSGHLSPTATTSVGVSYTYVNSDSRTPTIVGTSYYKLLDKSPHMFTATATQWFGHRVSVSLDMSAFSKYTMTIFGAGARQFVFDGPVKADAVFHYEIPLADRHSAEFYVKVENLFNQRPYENGFIGPKAWAVAGIRLRY